MLFSSDNNTYFRAFLQIRLGDWKLGEISDTYVKKKLKEVSKRITDYESTITPSGWQCHWDRYANPVQDQLYALTSSDVLVFVRLLTSCFNSGNRGHFAHSNNLPTMELDI